MPFEIGQLVRKTSDGFLVKNGEICTVLRYRDGDGCTMYVRVESNEHMYWVNPDCCELVDSSNEDINSFMNAGIDDLFDEFS